MAEIILADSPDDEPARPAQRRDPPPTAPVMPTQHSADGPRRMLWEVLVDNHVRVELVKKSWRIPWRWLRRRDPQIDDIGVYM